MSEDKSPVNVLYLSYDGLTDPLGQSQILPYIIGLGKLEYHFTIISFEKPDAFRKYGESIRSICINKAIHWRPLKYHKSPPVLSTLYDLWQLHRIATKEHRSTNFTIVHCRSYITSLVGMKMKRRYGIRFLFDMRGFWADERIESGLWNLNSYLYRKVYAFFKWKEKQFIQQADHIVSLTNAAKIEIRSWQLSLVPITVIPTCVDMDIFDPDRILASDRQKLKSELGIPENEFVLLYLGSWGTWYLTTEMLGFFSALKKIEKTAKFLIVTQDNVDLNGYEYRDDVILRSAQRELVPLFISIADASVLFIRPTYSKMASCATKMGEILAMNVPVITNPGWGDMDDLIRSGTVLIHEIEKQNVLLSLLKRRQNLTRDYCFSNLSLKSGIDSYATIYRELSYPMSPLTQH